MWWLVARKGRSNGAKVKTSSELVCGCLLLSVLRHRAAKQKDEFNRYKHKVNWILPSACHILLNRQVKNYIFFKKLTEKSLQPLRGSKGLTSLSPKNASYLSCCLHKLSPSIIGGLAFFISSPWALTTSFLLPSWNKQHQTNDCVPTCG